MCLLWLFEEVLCLLVLSGTYDRMLEPGDKHTGPSALACASLIKGLRERRPPQLFNAGPLLNAELLCAIG